MYYCILFIILIAAETGYMAWARRRCPALHKVTHPIAGGATWTVNSGGWLFYPAMVAAALLFDLQEAYTLMLVAAAPLWVVCFVDDMRGLSITLRISVQALVAAVAVFYWIGTDIGLYLLVVLMLVSLMNAYNFMDGISGMLALYSIVSLGSLVVALLEVPALAVYVPAVGSVLVAVVVFSLFNVVRPDRLFAGDVGAVIMGLFVAWMLAALIYTDGDVTWLTLVCVFLVDTGCTLAGRLWRRENIFTNHHKHLYQRLTARGHAHHKVAVCYAGAQLLLSAGYLLIPTFYRVDWFIGAYVVCFLTYAGLHVRFTRRAK